MQGSTVYKIDWYASSTDSAKFLPHGSTSQQTRCYEECATFVTPLASREGSRS